MGEVGPRSSDYWRGVVDTWIKQSENAVVLLRQDMARMQGELHMEIVNMRKESDERFRSLQSQQEVHARFIAKIAGIGIALAIIATPFLNLVLRLATGR